MITKRNIVMIQNRLEHYVTVNSLKSLVLGVSGGIDSAVTAALASPVCVKLGIPLIGRSIPIETNKPDEVQRAILCGEAFCDDFMNVDMTAVYLLLRQHMWHDIFQDENSLSEMEVKIANGNLKARLRMMLLYHIAGVKKGMVLSTDNFTEYNLGFWTIHGDEGDYGMIQTMWKTEVYELAEHLIDEYRNELAKKALQLCIDADATDGLGISKTSLDQIGASTFKETDALLKSFLYSICDVTTTNHPVIKRHLKSEFKRKRPINLTRSEIGLD
jgi:NAD+ synthetase